MDGILLIDKPSGWTSFDVIKKLRGASKEKRIGHAGTLDPMATGVLPVMFGKATPLCDRLPNETKRYLAKVQLGTLTDTQDITGTVIEKRDYTGVTKEMVLDATNKFLGDIKQVPPMYSALWVNGQRLYDLARQGVEVERKARDITIHSIKAYDFDMAEGNFWLDVTSSKGTYIRTLAYDIGEMLGCGATLSELRRTISSGFDISDCITLDEALALANDGKLAEHLMPSYTAFTVYPELKVGKWQEKMLLNGVRLSIGKVGNPLEGNYRVWCNDTFLGLGTVIDSQLRLKQL